MRTSSNRVIGRGETGIGDGMPAIRRRQQVWIPARRIIAILLVVFTCSPLLAQGTKTGKSKKRRTVFAPIQTDEKLPHVLIIGDSISIGYTLPTRKLLAGKANVHRIPTNGGPTIRGLQNIEAWLGKRRWDVIHFNWGLHDLKMDKEGKHQVPLKEYDMNLRKLVKYMKPRARILIWASTTPVPNAKVSPPRRESDVVRYNAAAKTIMKENGIIVNDLYSSVLPKLAKLQRKANVHFTPAGSQALAQQVAGVIEASLKKLPR